MTEEWRDVVGWEEFYEVSSHGRVRSKDRVIKQWNGFEYITRTHEGRYLKPDQVKGYERVRLRRYKKDERKQVHRLVLEAFDGPCPHNHVGCHNDGNSLNNKRDNLRWDTPENNEKDKITHGTILKGENNHLSSLTERDVIGIKQLLYESDLSYKIIGDVFDVSLYAIYHINNGQTWKHTLYKKDEKFPIRLYKKGTGRFIINC